MSEYIACPYLFDPIDDFTTDFELQCELLSSSIGLLISFLEDDYFYNQLNSINSFVFNSISSIRNNFSIPNEHIDFINSSIQNLKSISDNSKGFILPQGTTTASCSHILRVQSKSLVRLIFRIEQSGACVDKSVATFFNLLSAYFFNLSLALNKRANVLEIPFSK